MATRRWSGCSGSSIRCARTPTRRRAGSGTCASQTPLDITWRFFSLEDINREDGQEAPVGTAVVVRLRARCGSARSIRRELGNDARRPVVRDGRPRVLRRRREDARPRVHAEVIARGRVRPGARRARDRRSDRPPTRCAPITRTPSRDYGGHGVPTIVFESGYAVYGPVVVPAPTGDDALALWDLVRGDAAVPAPVRAAPPEDGRRPPCTSRPSSTPTSRPTRWQTIEKPALCSRAVRRSDLGVSRSATATGDDALHARRRRR